MKPAIRQPPGLLDEHALDLRSFLLVLPVSTVGVLTVIPSGVQTAVQWRFALLASVAAALAMGLVMGIGAQLRRRVRSAALAQALTLAVIVAAGAARGLAVGLTFDWLGLSDRVPLSTRTASSALIFGLWLLLVGALVSSAARHRRVRQRLVDEVVMHELQTRLLDEQRFRATRGSEEQRLLDTAHLVRYVLDDEAMVQAGDYSRVASQMQDVLDGQLRPLLHEMWTAQTPPVIEDAQSTRAFLQHALLTPVPLPWVVPLLAVLVAASGLLAVDPWTAVVAAVAETLVTTALILIERTVRPRATPRSRAALAIALLGLPLVTAGLLTADQVQGEVSTLALLSLIVTPLIVVCTACAARVILEIQGGERAAMQRRLESGQWSEQLLVLEQRAAGSEAAHRMHNTVQARLTAAAMQLRSASLEGDHERAERALQDARAALDSAGVDPEAADIPVLDRLEAVVEAWRGIVDVRISCSPELSGCPNARVALDAIEECIANASRHAAASVVDVQITIEGDDMVVAVCDNGTPFDEAVEPGLGTMWMRQVADGRFVRERTVEALNRVALCIRIAGL